MFAIWLSRKPRLTPFNFWCPRRRQAWLPQLAFAGFLLVLAASSPATRAAVLYMDASNPTGVPAIDQFMPAIAAHQSGICAAAAAADVMWEWSDVAPYNTAVPMLVPHPASANPPEAWPATFGNWAADARSLRTTLETLIYGPGQNNGYGEAGGMTKYLKNTGFDHINAVQNLLGVSGRTDGLSVHSYNGAKATYQNLFNSVVSTNGNGQNALLFALSIANIVWHNADGTFVNNMGSKSRHALTLTGVDVPNASQNDPGNNFIYFSNGWSNFSANANPVSTAYYDQYTNLTIDNSANNNPDNKFRINANAANNPGGRQNTNNYLVRGIPNSNNADYVQMYQYISVVRGGSPYVILSVTPATQTLNEFTYTVTNPDSSPGEHFFLELHPAVLSNLIPLLSSNVLAPQGWGVEVWSPAGAVTTRLSSLNPTGAPGDGVALFAPQIAEPGSSYNPPWQPGWGGLHFYWTGLTGTPIIEGSALDFSFLYDTTAPYSIDGTNLTVVGEEANVAQYFGTIGGPTIICDVDGDGKIDINDINAIFSARNTRATPGDPRDADGDGIITVNDARICVNRCTNAHCAP